MPKLYLLRHAKSDWDDPAVFDFDRPLAPRGRRAAGLVAEHLRQARVAPGLVLCSPARRTRETFDLIAPALGDDVRVQFEEDLYGASVHDLLECLRAVDDGVESVLLIGHNPGIQQLALTLAAGGEKLDAVAQKYPTAALATLDIAGEWADLAPGAAVLRDFASPKRLAAS